MANSYTYTFTQPSGTQFTLTGQLLDGTLTVATLNGQLVSGDLFLKVYESKDGTKTAITNMTSIEEDIMYEIEGYGDALLTEPTPVSNWTYNGASTLDIVFEVDRRPLYVWEYAAQRMQEGNTTTTNNTGEHWGCTKQSYRKCPAPGSAPEVFEDSANNGPLKGLEEKCYPVHDMGWERFNITNIAGWTCLPNATNAEGTDSGPQQHFPSNPYSGMLLSDTKVYRKLVQGPDNTDFADSFVSQTPFTTDGLTLGSTGNSKGDLFTSWKYALAAFRTRIEDAGGTPDFIAYAGYRPFYTNKNMTTMDKTLMGYSKQSSQSHGLGWDGEANSPGFTPEPGFDYVDSNDPGVSSSDEKFKEWWTPELGGVHDMGFTSIGLDTGARVWQNAEGMVAQSSIIYPAAEIGTRDGSDRLIKFFRGYGLKAMVESIDLDQYTTPGVTTPWTNANIGTYENVAGWALFDTVWGYDGQVTDYNGNEVTLTRNKACNVENASGTDGGATIEGGSFNPLNTEVHAIFRWNSSWTTSILDNFGWLALKQLLYDFHSTGIIVSCGGDSTTAKTDGSGYVVEASEFYGYVLSLHEDENAERPAAPTLLGKVDATLSSYGAISGWKLNNTAWTSIASIDTGSDPAMSLPPIDKAYFDKSFTGDSNFDNPLGFNLGDDWNLGTPASRDDWNTAAGNLAKKLYLKCYFGTESSQGAEIGTTEPGFVPLGGAGLVAPMECLDSNVEVWPSDGTIGNWAADAPVYIELWQEG